MMSTTQQAGVFGQPAQGGIMKPTCTKIVATLGPASLDPATIAALIDAGVDVFRLNFSHGDHTTHRTTVATIRAQAGNRAIGILQDLQGPRIRTGRLEHGPVMLSTGQDIILQTGPGLGNDHRIMIDYDLFARDVAPGERILISDGLIELQAIETDGSQVRCSVLCGGELGERKGINLPDSRLTIAAPTEKDIADLALGIELGVDFVALSFVASAADIVRLREAMQRIGGPGCRIPIIAKIERPQALDNLEEITAAADGVMVARGDLGIEMPTEDVPAAQKRIIRCANRLARPVITATQMLESMIVNPRPTRAEAADVANAVLDGTDAVMLSGETSIGAYPLESVRIMDRIACRAEAMLREVNAPDADTQQPHRSSSAIAGAACSLARQLPAAAIGVFTMTGATATSLSQCRPHVPVYALTPDRSVFQRMTLLWGVCPIMIDMFTSTEEMFSHGDEQLRQRALVETGETVVYLAGSVSGMPGATDLLKIRKF
jgi:pyruvate kinase